MFLSGAIRREQRSRLNTPGLLKTVIYKYVETPKHTGEVLKPLQHLLAVDFSVTRDKWHLLPCPNGVADAAPARLPLFLRPRGHGVLQKR